jgi:hypothetical protein
MYTSSLIFGGCLWLTSVAVTYWLWGIGAVIFGLIFIGLGIPAGLRCR